jgi:ribosomal protein S18 acetylase RimI-like enzyme
MISKAEIIDSLENNGGDFLAIADIEAYAEKVIKFGKQVYTIDEKGLLLAYILFYDNNPVLYISMVWTHPDFRGRGLAKNLLQQIISQTGKIIQLEVHKKNPAKYLYEKLNFRCTGANNEMLTMQCDSAKILNA